MKTIRPEPSDAPREERHLVVKYVELHPKERQGFINGHPDALLISRDGEVTLRTGEAATPRTVEALRRAADYLETELEDDPDA